MTTPSDGGATLSAGSSKVADTGATRAYQYLRQQLLSGRFKPGERLLYGPIGKEIGVSATPVREAAGRLANEGLVELVPQRGALVRRIDARELRHLYEVRLAIEPYAAGLAARRAGDNHRRDLSTLTERWDDLIRRHAVDDDVAVHPSAAAEFDEADHEFHQVVLAATANPAMVQAANQSHVLTRIFGVRRHLYTRQTLTRTRDEHAAIAEAIRGGDAVAARKAAERHIEHGRSLSLD